MKTRYSITPQMKDYDAHNQAWLPYLMFFQSPNIRSSTVNTDQYGFRHTYKNFERVDPYLNFNDSVFNLLVGGSCVYGVGATNDRYTIPSILNDNTSELWLNFGGRAYSSTQEILLYFLFHHKIPKVKRIIIMSGVNNLVLHFMSRIRSDLGSFFFQNQYSMQMNSVMSRKRKLTKFILSPILGSDLDYAHCSVRDLFDSFLKSKQNFKDNTISDTSVNTHGDSDDIATLLNILKRDMFNWKLLAQPLGVELHYILQPFHNWINKINSHEENRLFSILDNAQGANWKVMRDKLDNQLYKYFTAQLGQVCMDNNINYIDMNSHFSKMGLDHKWLFVDRVHCNNDGYKLCADIIQKKVLNQ